ncbi:MAG: glycerol-3-phosphate dehydrogenase/oxidase [Planctomycetes bacterium]|nr:glycerol-3-phosphate dehydrogenase/oxidase [Planctomycetota bacterium]
MSKLANTNFDLLIIGGGIYGAILFWQATLLGFSVGLIEKGDFAEGTSSNSQKIIHGGLRYLQQLNVLRMRQSIWSRGMFMRIAPHLVHPLMCLMPIYGHGLKGKETMSLGLRINDLVSFDRNDLSKKSKCIPNGKILSLAETNYFIPHLDQRNLMGSAQWYDALCSNTERIIIGLLRTACEKGAVVANYVKGVKLILNGYRVTGVKVKDQLTGCEFDILAKRVANCTGPWANEFLPHSNKNYKHPQKLVKGINIVVNKILPFNCAVGLKSKTARGRLYFAVPWSGKTIIGTEYSLYHGYPDENRCDEDGCLQLIDGFNQAYPFAQLKLDDVTFIHNGLLPVDGQKSSTNGEKSISKKFKILDHGFHGIHGFISIIGVKYTTAGYVSLKALKYLFPEIANTEVNFKQRLVGGDIDDFPSFRKEIVRRWETKIDAEVLVQLIENYGTETGDVFRMEGLQTNSFTKQGDHSLLILKGQTLFAIQEEMAMKLSDVVLRRTGIGTMKRPGKEILNKISSIMAEEHGWTETRRRAEIQEVNDFYPSFIT